MIVDDDLFCLLMLKQMLSKLEDFDLTIYDFSNGTEAI